MKNNNLLYLFFSFFVFLSCQRELKPYVTISGSILNKNSDSLVINNRKLKFRKVIYLNDKGVFKDTFKLKSPDFFSLFDGKEYAVLFLRNGDDISIKLDAKKFDESISFKGIGSRESQFLAKKALMEEQFMADDSLFIKSKDDLEDKMRSYNFTFLRELEDTESNDSLFLKSQDRNLKRFKKYIDKTYEDKSYILKKLSKGTTSPQFSYPYDNVDGKKTSLTDFKGKYVLVGFWATWCSYCKQEIPHLKKLLDDYQNKNFIYVGISTDRKEKRDKWKNFVKEKALPGVHLFANGDKDFYKKYRVSGIPRFILLNPQGEIIDATAPKASDPKLRELLNSLDL